MEVLDEKLWIANGISAPSSCNMENLFAREKFSVFVGFQFERRSQTEKWLPQSYDVDSHSVTFLPLTSAFPPPPLVA